MRRSERYRTRCEKNSGCNSPRDLGIHGQWQLIFFLADARVILLTQCREFPQIPPGLASLFGNCLQLRVPQEPLKYRIILRQIAGHSIVCSDYPDSAISVANDE